MTHFVSLALSHERRGDFAAAAAEYVRLIMLAEAEAEEEEAVVDSDSDPDPDQVCVNV